MFMNKNIGNAVSVLFYVTVMDISFFCGMTIFAMNFTSVVRIGLFVVGLVMAIGMLVMLLWMFHEINAGTKGD